jgi:hypothetical protein
MDQDQIEGIIRDRIGELQQLERSARPRSMAISYQDKRDELEALLLRIHGLSSMSLSREASGGR